MRFFLAAALLLAPIAARADDSDDSEPTANDIDLTIPLDEATPDDQPVDDDQAVDDAQCDNDDSQVCAMPTPIDGDDDSGQDDDNSP